MADLNRQWKLHLKVCACLCECLCVAVSLLNGDTRDTTGGPLLIYIMKGHTQAVQNVFG